MNAIVDRLENIWSQLAAKAEEAFFAQDQFSEDFWEGRARGIRIAIEAVKKEMEEQ